MSSRAAILAVAVACGCSSSNDDVCAPDDADGVIGGDVTLALTAKDDAFEPTISKVQNLTNVTLTITNAGAKPHGFSIDCLATPNSNGCPAQSCFPAASTIAPIAPGGTVTLTFAVPRVEGIYTFRSDVATGQLIVQ
jgi:hypothetical protein